MEERLARRGIAAEARGEAVEALTRTGLIDDERFARSRALSLADRNYGDAAIRHDLVERGVDEELINQALAELPREQERAARVVAKRGRSPRTLRYLASRGFDLDTIEQFAAGEAAELG